MTRSLHSICFALLLLWGFSSWFTKLSNFDFWWHIKTGQYILEHKGLPDKDPFTFTFLENDKDIPDWPDVVLKSFWLSQVIFYFIYQRFGPLGIILFKSFIFSLMLMITWKYLLNRSASRGLMTIMFAGFILFSKEFVAERPQIFSFLFAAVVLYLLENIREAYSRQYVEDRENRREKGEVRFVLYPLHFTLLPVVMLLWANMHRGYPVGMAFILVYIIGLLRRNGIGQSGLLPLTVYTVSLLVTLINPVTYHPLTTLISFQGSWLQRETLEFLSPLKIITYLNINWYPFFVLLILSLIVMIITIHSKVMKRSDTLPFEHVILLIGTSLASLVSLRYGIFFMIVAIPIITVYLSKRFVIPVPARFRKGILIVLTVILFILTLRSPLFQQAHDTLIDEAILPVGAVEFMRSTSPQSNIFNDINWGGYFIWKLYPDYKVFSDTRTLNLEIYRQYLSILNANERTYFGIPEWKALLDMYGINTIIHGAVNPYNGVTYPLILKLLKDDDWHLVYWDGIAAIFTRKMSGRFTDLPKSRLLGATS